MEEYNFTVLMCVYNGDNAKYFDMALSSVFEQTLKPDELVLVVDGPVNKDIYEVINKYERQYNNIMKVIQLEKNSGLGIARKIGMDNCSNNLIAIMDSDDISISERFEKQIKIFKQNKDLAVLGGQINEFMGNMQNIIGMRKVPCDNESIRKYMKKRNPINHMTVMFKKDMVEKAGGYIDWRYHEDYYLWIRMMINNMVFANSDEVLVYARVDEKTYQRRGGLRYFKDAERLQRFMLENKLIGIGRYALNVVERFILQVLMPNCLRGWVFRKFARKKA